MISVSTANSLFDYMTTQTTTDSSSSANATSGTSTSASTSTGTSAAVTARLAATAQAALQAAGSTHKAAIAGRALDKQQATLASDLRTAMTRAGVKLTGAVEFSVSSDGTVAVNAGAADKAATTAFLKADTSRPSFATRIATQAQDALKVSGTIQQSAAISQAARYGGNPGGVMGLYTSLMQTSNPGAAVFSVSASASSLTYPGSLATKA